MSIAVIGAGIAGAAAAHALAEAGERPILFHERAGASALYSGALDFEIGSRAVREVAFSQELSRFAAALGVWELTPGHVATSEGNVRPAHGRERAMLNLEACAGKRVAVVDVERDDWDARLLAKSFGASAWARATNTSFVPVRVRALAHTFERRISTYDFASLFDAPERAMSLLSALGASAETPDAWLFGPWLGFERSLASELSASLGVPVGETTSAPGGVAGARFERARDRLFAVNATVKRARVRRIEAQGRRYSVETDAGEHEEFGAIVLATGGIAAGGVALDRSFERRGGTGFRLSFEAPLAIELDGEVVEGVSSLASLDFVERGLELLSRVGIGADEYGAARGAPGVFVAGDALAGRPRAALFAAESGIVAAKRALVYASDAG